MSHRADLLVVDDEPVLLGAVRRICEAEGLEVDAAPSADTGLGSLSRGRYRLLLLDLLLPGIGGMQLLEAAQRDHPETPVVVISGSATRDRTANCFRRGAFDVLPKPFDANELLAVVRRAFAFFELDASRRQAVSLAEFRRGRGATNGGPTELFSLGRHAWVSLERNGSVTIGIGEDFRPLSREIRAVELPAVETETLQGNVCATITTMDELVHRVWSPLSVRIVQTNPAWKEGSAAIETFPERWLVRALPTGLKNELEILTRR